MRRLEVKRLYLPALAILISTLILAVVLGMNDDSVSETVDAAQPFIVSGPGVKRDDVMDG